MILAPALAFTYYHLTGEYVDQSTLESCEAIEHQRSMYI